MLFLVGNGHGQEWRQRVCLKHERIIIPEKETGGIVVLIGQSSKSHKCQFMCFSMSDLFNEMVCNIIHHILEFLRNFYIMPFFIVKLCSNYI